MNENTILACSGEYELESIKRLDMSNKSMYLINK